MLNTARSAVGLGLLTGVEEERSQEGESDDETSSVFRTTRKMLRPRKRPLAATATGESLLALS